MDHPQGLIHLVLSLLAMGLLCLAFLQAIVLAIQDSRLHKNPSHRLQDLPSLQTMENILFKLIWIGFIVLSGVLISAVLFFANIFQQPLLSKTLLSFLTWCVYATLLIGRYGFGWRGRFAVYWVIAGFVLLMLVYGITWYFIA